MCALPVDDNNIAMADKGNKGISSCSTNSALDFIETEAECEDEIDTLEALFDESDGTDLSDLIDNCDEPDEGRALELLNRQQLEEDRQLLTDLKRKYLSPSPKQAVLDLSPRIQLLSVSPRGQSSKRRLFEDSGIDNEAEDSITEVEKVASEPCNTGELCNAGDLNTVVQQPLTNTEDQEETAVCAYNNNIGCIDILRSSNRHATVLAKFKDTFDVSYKELTRPFQSDKSCCVSWVVVAFGVLAELAEACKALLKPHCVYMQIINPSLSTGVTVLFLFEFINAKCRETVRKLLCNMLQLQEEQLMADPPRQRSVAVALWFYRKSLSNISFCVGDMPEWIKKQIMVNHQQETNTFELAAMVQYAYDNDLWDETDIAYRYACLAPEEPNAAAWLKCNNQFKYVKDCAQMVKMYKKYEMKQMSMAEWVTKCGEKVTDDGDWKKIINFLKYQNISIVGFLTSMRTFLKGQPKKNCMIIWGPPDTGKSMFCYSLIQFMRGKVVSFVNSKSQFWLQPLSEGKIGLLDDATYPCLQYMDVYLRNGLDGNAVSIDCKHRAPVQIKMPPLLVTSNIDVHADPSLKYLHSRMMPYSFPNKVPIDDNGNAVYTFTDGDWKCFFSKLQKQLDLCEPEESADGEPGRAFRCCAGQTAEPV